MNRSPFLHCTAEVNSTENLHTVVKASNYLQGGSVVSYMCFIVIFIKNSISMVPKPVTMETGHLEQGGERVQRGG